MKFYINKFSHKELNAPHKGTQIIDREFHTGTSHKTKHLLDGTVHSEQNTKKEK